MRVTFPAGWEWFSGIAEGDGETPPEDGFGPELAVRFARCFSTEDGRAVLDHLKAITLHRVLTPAATDPELRHLEGQRHLIAYVCALVARGLRG